MINGKGALLLYEVIKLVPFWAAYSMPLFITIPHESTTFGSVIGATLGILDTILFILNL